MSHHFVIMLLIPGLLAAFGLRDELALTLRRQVESFAGSGEFRTDEQPARWKAGKTAIVVCDMWDRHWCAGASRRVDALAPPMNKVLNSARDLGAFIIHAPSDTMPYYQESLQRQRARTAPPVDSEPEDVALWKPRDPTREPPLPVDDSDGGCDDLPPCPTYSAWTRQHPALRIAGEDAISDNGAEIYRLLTQRRIANIVVMGVHTNMCVLGRSFGIRRMVTLGKNVVLMRDMTDCLYNPRRPPFVSHAQGTELIIQHIETYWCPSITSDQIVGGAPFAFDDEIA